MLRGPEPGPRSPLRVAVLTFGAVVLIGTMLALIIFGKQSVVSEDPSARGRQVGQALGVLGLIAAAVAYVVQRRRSR